MLLFSVIKFKGNKNRKQVKMILRSLVTAGKKKKKKKKKRTNKKTNQKKHKTKKRCSLRQNWGSNFRETNSQRETEDPAFTKGRL